MIDKLVAFSKPFIEPFLSLYIYSTTLGILIGVFITYKLIVGRERVLSTKDEYKTLYNSFFIKLSAIRTNIEIKKRAFGKRNFKKLNNENKKKKNLSLIAEEILDTAEDMLVMVRKYEQEKFSMIVISRYFAVEQIKEQISAAESAGLGFGEKKKVRQARISRLYYELACTKISFVEAILEDMKKISRYVRIQDKETRETIKYLINLCRDAKKKEISKVYSIEEPMEIKGFGERETIAG